MIVIFAGWPDLLQQIENGALTVIGVYRALGRLYRGIICNDLRQYVMLGDAAAMTDNVIGNEDDRWVFTENNPTRELTTAAQMAAASRVLRRFNDTLSVQALNCARELCEVTEETDRSKSAKIHWQHNNYCRSNHSRSEAWKCPYHNSRMGFELFTRQKY